MYERHPYQSIAELLVSARVKAAVARQAVSSAQGMEREAVERAHGLEEAVKALGGDPTKDQWHMFSKQVSK